MTQQVQELIDKIKAEGIQEAQGKSREIQNQAEAKAKEIIAQAKAQADQIIAQAKDESKKMKDTTTTALQQAARNMLLSLRKDIEHMLKKVIASQVRDTLTPEYLAGIIDATIKNYLKNAESQNDIQITLSNEDTKKLKESFLAKLQKQFQQKITFKPGNEVSKGFVISFDNGKSSFDFTDESLAEYLSAYLNEETAALLKGSVS